MGNEQNLKVPSSEEARKYGSKGGKASAEARKRRKTMREALSMILELPASNENKNVLDGLNLGEDVSNHVLLAAAAFRSALKGDVRAMYFISDILGSKGMTEAEKERLKIEKQKIKLEEEKIKKIAGNESEDDERVIIVNDLEEFSDDDAQE